MSKAKDMVGMIIMTICKYPTLEMKELEMKRKSKGKGILIGLTFAGQGTIECMVGFMIDIHTNKRRTLMLSGFSSATKRGSTLHIHRPSDMVRSK